MRRASFQIYTSANIYVRENVLRDYFCKPKVMHCEWKGRQGGHFLDYRKLEWGGDLLEVNLRTQGWLFS